MRKFHQIFRFTEIPDCIYNIASLEILLANGNKITTINIDGLSKLKRLATLDLANNNINHVPPELGNMKQLRLLYNYIFANFF